MMALLLAFVSSTASSACTPVPQFMYVFFGPAMWGYMSLIGLPVIVIFKCYFFARNSDLPTHDSVSSMIFANVYSTIPGLVGTFAMMMVSTVMFFEAFIVILILLYFPAKMVGKTAHIGTFAALVILVFCVLLSILFFNMAGAASFQSSTEYWFFKILFTTFAIIVGLFVTTGFEYSAIVSLTKKQVGDKNLYKIVLRSNLYAMLISVGIIAMIMLPERLASHDFLIMVKAFIFSVS